MGFISDLRKATESRKFRSPTDRGPATDLWNEIFGVIKEKPHPVSRPVPGGVWGRSTVSSDASQLRLLQAMRSMSPGGWSDDRWEQSNHFVGIMYVAGHRKYEQMAQSEFQVYHKDPYAPDGKREVTSVETTPERNGPYDLVQLLERPNKEDSFGDLLYRWSQQMDLTGSALTWMVPSQLGIPMELYSIPTAIAVPQPAVNPDFPDGYWRIQPVYPYGPWSTYPTPNSAVGAPIPAQWMLQFKFPHPLLRYDGFSPLTGLRLHMDEVESIDRSRWYKMKRSANPDAVLNMDEMEGAQPLPGSEIERIRAEYEQFQGPENHGKLIVTSPGMRLDPFGANPVDMEYQAGWEQLVSFVMAGLGITKPAAGMIEDASYASLFATLKQLHLLTLKPMCDRFASKLTRQLAPFFGNDLIVEIRCPRIDDHDVKIAKLNMAVGGKCITKNQLLKELDLPMTDQPWGNDMAGDPSPFEQQQAAMAQQQMMMGGMPPQGPQQQMVEGEEQPVEGDPQLQKGNALDSELLALLQSAPPDEDEEQTDRPSPGNLGKGSLGPRKSLQDAMNKRIRYLKKRQSMNGNGVH